MFNRIEFKTSAKTQLTGNWKIPLLATLTVMIIEFVFQIPSFIATMNFYITGIQPESNNLQDFVNSLILLLVSGIFDIALSFLYLELAKDAKNVTFQSFLQGLNLWQKGICVVLWNFLWSFLWALLFLIPGIIKSISYSQMYFIVAENPTINAKKAIKMSMKMTKGYKGDLFVLLLSFLGWALLSIVTGGILFLWVKPYIGMTFVNTYHFLKKEALESGILNYEDFGMPHPQQPIITEASIPNLESIQHSDENSED
jgi:uncharacterized membrane protein